MWTTTQLLWMVLAHSTAWALLQHRLGPQCLLLHSVAKRLSPRIAKCSVKDLTKSRGIPILSYCAPIKSGLSSISFNSISSLLSPLTLPSLYNCNLLWRCGWMTRDSTETGTDVPNWSGYMQHISKGDHTSAAMVTLLPIIDLNPSDSHCIYSTLYFIEQ
jgi:hypothetical protein